MNKPLTNPTVNDLFDLVAPIVICGSADLMYEAKAIKAWQKIAQIPGEVWRSHGCPDPHAKFEAPLADWDLKDNDDFGAIYDGFALDAYNTLFEAIMGDNGDDEWEFDYDYWGAKGYRRPGDTNKSFTLSGDACGFFPMFETADLLIQRIKSAQG